MRLAYLMSRYPGPSQVFVQREIAGLRERGVDVAAVSVRRVEQLLSEGARTEAARTHALLPTSAAALLGAHARAARHPAAWLGSLAGALRDGPAGRRLMQVLYWGEAVLLWDHLRREGIEHVHVHFASNASDIALIATRLGRRAGSGPARFSIHLHGPTDFFDVDRNRIALKAREAAGVVCISDYARGQVQSRLQPHEWDRVRVVRYGAPLRALPARARRTPGDPLKLLTVARLASVKGHPVLLEAMARLVREGFDVRLDAVGDGPQRDELEALAEQLGLADRVVWHGALGPDRVAELYDQADVFCLPSFAEGLPVVLLEAMAAGLPVVATAITGVPEAVVHERHGLLVAPGRPDEIAAAVGRLARNAEEATRLGAAGRERIETELNAEDAARRMHEALEAILAAQSPSPAGPVAL